MVSYASVATDEKPMTHTWQGMIGLCSHEADQHSGKHRAHAKVVADLATQVKDEVKDLRNQ